MGRGGYEAGYIDQNWVGSVLANIANAALNFWCGNYPLAVLGVSCAALIGLVTRSSEKLVKGE